MDAAGDGAEEVVLGAVEAPKEAVHASLPPSARSCLVRDHLETAAGLATDRPARTAEGRNARSGETVPAAGSQTSRSGRSSNARSPARMGSFQLRSARS